MRVKYDKNMIPGYQTVMKKRFLTIFGLKKQRLLTISEGGFFEKNTLARQAGRMHPTGYNIPLYNKKFRCIPPDK